MELLLRVYRDDGLWEKIDIISGVLSLPLYNHGCYDSLPLYNHGFYDFIFSKVESHQM